jgi:hypothetical protein
VQPQLGQKTGLPLIRRHYRNRVAGVLIDYCRCRIVDVGELEKIYYPRASEIAAGVRILDPREHYRTQERASIRESVSFPMLAVTFGAISLWLKLSSELSE